MAYLANLLNAYAHLSTPKPFVHFIGPGPPDVALDSRTSGNLCRLVRRECRTNVILRHRSSVPVLAMLSLDDLSP